MPAQITNLECWQFVPESEGQSIGRICPYINDEQNKACLLFNITARQSRMSSLRLMQLITERLVKTFQDIHEAISCEVNKMHIIEELPNSNQLEAQKQPEEPNIKITNPGLAIQKPLLQKNERTPQEGSPQKVQKKTKKAATNLQKPKKPLSSFKQFLLQMKSNSQNKQDLQHQNLVAKLATKKWHSMSNQEKKPYQQLEEKQLLEYEKNLSQYYSDNPEEKRRDLEKKEMKEQKKKQKLVEKREEKTKEKQRHKSKQQQKNQENADANCSSEEISKIEKKQKLKSENQSYRKLQKQEVYRNKIQVCQSVKGNGQQSDEEELQCIIRISRGQQLEHSRVAEQARTGNREVALKRNKQNEDQINRRQIDQFLNLDQPSDSLGEDF